MVEPCVQGLTSEINIGCLLTPDGDICVYDFLYAPYDLGTLMSKNGGAADVTYADHGAWTGAPLPAPAACPVESGFSLCGPHCAPCPSGGSCTGRSPLHPYGICVPTDVATTASKCFTGFTGCALDDGGAGGCLRWLVEPSAQNEADDFSFCMPLATCETIADGYPDGGVSCIKSVTDAGSGDM
jgi:hypothetical protein